MDVIKYLSNGYPTGTGGLNNLFSDLQNLLSNYSTLIGSNGEPTAAGKQLIEKLGMDYKFFEQLPKLFAQMGQQAGLSTSQIASLVNFGKQVISNVNTALNSMDQQLPYPGNNLLQDLQSYSANFDYQGLYNLCQDFQAIGTAVTTNPTGATATQWNNMMSGMQNEFNDVQALNVTTSAQISFLLGEVQAITQGMSQAVDKFYQGIMQQIQTMGSDASS